MTPIELAYWLSDLARELEEPPVLDVSAIQPKVSEIAAADIGSDFEGSHGPDGSTWQPLKSRVGKPLVLTGDLEEAATKMGADVGIEISGNQVSIVLNPDRLPSYWEFQDQGTNHSSRGGSHIPARPFVGLSDSAVEKIADVIATQLADQAVVTLEG